MGNRAVITTQKDFDNNGYGIYLHWNGGRDSVEGFMKYCKLSHLYSPANKNSDVLSDYAKMYSAIYNFMGDSVYFGKIKELDCDNGDNGTYIIDEKFNIVDRKYLEGREQFNHPLNEMLCAIDEKQPKHLQLSKEFIEAKEVKISDLKIGDEVFMFNSLKGRYDKHKVVGFGEDRMVNGHEVKGFPFVDAYYAGDEFDLEDARQNPNNYLAHSGEKEKYDSKTIRIVNSEKENIRFTGEDLAKQGKTTSDDKDVKQKDDKEKD